MDPSAVEPPSRQLLDVLSRYGLATPADLRRCRPQVRRLAHDLPTFDSVWIDALTQSRVLTPLQAKLLESEQPQRLQVGPCILVDEWENAGRWTLRVAKHRGTGRRCLLTFVDVPANERPKALDQVRDVIARLLGLSHPSIIAPQGCDETDDRLVVVSPFVSGPTLKQLLVRRGRFPISVVTDIAWQLIDGLAALEEREVVHGDVTLTSVRLTARGQAVLLHPGVMPAAGSRVSIHAPLGPENYDGIAPELISTGRPATPATDLYAVGCVLWQLLAGRPPYPTGDPLAKLAAHQTKPMDDVRRWVPDAPADLAALIAQLTSKHAEHRGSGPREIRDNWPLGTRSRHSHLAQFHSSFGTVAPRHGDVHRSASKFPLKAVAVMLFLLSGVSLSLLDAGARNEVLRFAGRAMGAAERESSELAASAGAGDDVSTANGKPSDLLPFPSRAVDGVIELTSAGPYAVGNVNIDGPLVIRAAAGIEPRIVVSEQPLRLAATVVRIEGVRIDAVRIETAPGEERHSDRGDGTPTVPALVAIQSQQVVLDGCRLIAVAADPVGRDESLSDPERAAAAVVEAAAVAWKIPDPSNPTGGKLLMRNTVVSGPLHAVETHAMPRSIGFDNCLKQGAGALLRLAHSGKSVPLRVHLRQTTLRNSGGVVRWSKAAAGGSLQPLLLIAENSVFDVPPARGAFLEFAVQTVPNAWERLIRVTGEGSLLRVGMLLAASDLEGTTHPTAIETSRLRIEGLLIDAFEFAGSGTSDPSVSVIALSQAPRSTPTPPGIDAERLTNSAVSPVVRQVARP